MKNSFIGQGWLVLALALGFGGALAGVEAALSGRIAQNKLNETLSQIPALVPGAKTGQQTAIEGKTVFRAVDGAGKLVGWVVPARGQGFADRIELLIGLDTKAETIKGLYVLAQKETPGLGNKITEDDWRGQFADKPTAKPLAVTKAQPQAGEIRAITGATISSESVCTIVNDTIAAWGEKLRLQAQKE
jgi:electron transport complex protein RnfG